MSAERGQRGTIVVAYTLVFVAFTDNFSMLPTVGPYTQHLGGDALAMGVAVAAYSVTNLLLNVVGGVMLDRSGRRRLLLAGLVLAAGSMALYSMAGSVPSLLLVRLIHGAAGGILVPAVFTTIADLAPARGSGQAMGRAGALIGGAAIVAPAMAGVLRQAAGFDAVFWAAATLLVGGALLAAVWLPETLAPVRLKPVDPDAGGGEAVRAGVERPSRGLWAAYLGIFVLTFALGGLTAFLPEIAESMGHPASVSGLLFTTFGLVAAVIMVGPWSRLVDQRGVARPLVAGVALVGVSLVLLVGASSLGWLVAACGLFGAGFGLCFPATSGMVGSGAPAQRRGRAYGVFYAVFSLGVVTGAPLGGLSRTLFPAHAASPFLPVFAPVLLLTVLSLAVILWLGRGAVGREATSPTG